MKPIFGRILTHPLSITILNFAILLLAYSALKETWFAEESDVHHIHEAVELWEGFGTILLGFGVALEERGSLLKIFGCTPDQNPRMEHLCHNYGVLFVVLGVLIEVLAWLIKIPNSVLNTEGVEFVLLQMGAISASAGVFLQLRFQIKLWKSR